MCCCMCLQDGSAWLITAVFWDILPSNKLLKVFVVCHFSHLLSVSEVARQASSTVRERYQLPRASTPPNTVCPHDIVLNLPSRDMPEPNGDDKSRRILAVLYLREWRSIASAFLVCLLFASLSFAPLTNPKVQFQSASQNLRHTRCEVYTLKGQRAPDKKFLFFAVHIFI